jgi:sensor histidine kinase YesM
MKQILLNCVECCLEKTRRGRIDITAKYIEEKRIVKFTVKDSGQGLEDGELKKLRGSGPRPIDINNIGIENLLHRVQELLK